MFARAACIVVASLLVAAPAGALDLRLTPAVQDVPGVVDIVNAGDGTNRLYLVQQSGLVRVLEGGQLRTEPFLDIAGTVSISSEQGLLSIVFPPGYAQKRYFYAWYTEAEGSNTLSRFRLTQDGTRGDPASETVLLSIPDPFANHNGGKLLFGPDGFLYLSLGDGGGGGDPLDAGQDRSTLLGKIIRIDTESGATPYAIPAGNPFTGQVGRTPEIWAYGLCNPWRMAFDPATGELFIADVGQSQREEVNVQPAGVGGRNYGWSVFEGTRCFGTQAECNGLAGATAPVAEYSHGLGCSITGGHVYRGTKYAAMTGIYFYGDYCSGRIFGLARSGGGFTATEHIDTAFSISTFGVDEVGDLYLSDIGTSTVYLVSDGPPVAGGMAITAGFTGAWFDPNQSGQGLLIEVLPNQQMFATWYTYRPEGGQAWLVAQGPITGDRAVLATQITTGARFIPNFDPNQVQLLPWGTLTLTFTGCNNGRVDYQSVAGFGTGSMQLTRLTQPAALTCP